MVPALSGAFQHFPAFHSLRVDFPFYRCPCYKIQGELYHRLGPLQPGSGQQPMYSQLYIYDHEEAIQYRL